MRDRLRGLVAAVGRAGPGMFNMIPQGGGDHHEHHRCPGEWIAVELMKGAARFLTREIRYDVSPQDLEIDNARLPALPRSHFVMSHIAWSADPPARVASPEVGISSP